MVSEHEKSLETSSTLGFREEPKEFLTLFCASCASAAHLGLRVHPRSGESTPIREGVLDTVWTRAQFPEDTCRLKTRTP